MTLNLEVGHFYVGMDGVVQQIVSDDADPGYPFNTSDGIAIMDALRRLQQMDEAFRRNAEAYSVLHALLDRNITYLDNTAVLPFENHDQAMNHIADARYVADQCIDEREIQIVVMSEKLKAARRWAASQEDAPDTDWAHGYDAAKRHLLLLIGIDVAISAGEDSGDDTFRK